MALESGDFHFTSMGTTEDMTRYTVGGYHPVRIGGIIGSTRKDDSSGVIAQYRVMHKLGFGSFAMVWLAQMTTSPAFVEVKITTADDASTNEAAMLKAVLKVRTIGERHVPTLLDHFILRGPNGEHLVLVTDVVAPILEVPFSGPLWRKTVALGLVKAVAHLHANGIVHGDLHLGNVGVAIPKLTDEDPDEIMQDLGAYNFIPVLPFSAAKQTSSLPPYVVSPCELPTFYKQLANSNLPQTKLFDFGGAHEVGKLPLDFQCAVVACAPETVFSLVVEKIDNPPMELPTDIWALGTAIYEIVTGSSLFYGVDYSGIFSKMAEMLGTLPEGWKEWWRSRSKAPAVSPSGADAWWIQRREILRKNCADDADVDALIALLRKILVLDPKARPTPEQILQDA